MVKFRPVRIKTLGAFLKFIEYTKHMYLIKRFRKPHLGALFAFTVKSANHNAVA